MSVLFYSAEGSVEARREVGLCFGTKSEVNRCISGNATNLKNVHLWTLDTVALCSY